MNKTFPVLALGCHGGTDIKDAIPEAIEVAKSAGQMVYLLHNYAPLRVFPDSTFDELMADWNRKAGTPQGET